MSTIVSRHRIGCGRQTGRRETPWCDILGVLASLACAVHCLIGAVAVSAASVAGLSCGGASGLVHRGFALVCIVCGFGAFVPGYYQHRQGLPLIFGAVGLLVVVISAAVTTDLCGQGCSLFQSAAVAPGPATADAVLASEDSLASPQLAMDGPFLTTIGGLLLIIGHVLNRLCCNGSRGGTQTRPKTRPFCHSLKSNCRRQ